MTKKAAWKLLLKRWNRAVGGGGDIDILSVLIAYQETIAGLLIARGRSRKQAEEEAKSKGVFAFVNVLALEGDEAARTVTDPATVEAWLRSSGLLATPEKLRRLRKLDG